MKAWVKTKLEKKVSITGETIRVPYLANQPVRYSVMELGNDECLCRVSGTPEQINTIAADSSVLLLTDKEAKELIKSRNPNSDLENIDVPDAELEELAKVEELNPHEIKRDVQIPTRGRQVLQCQEMHLLRILATKRGVDLSDLEEDIELGSKHAFNRALARLRGRRTGLREIYRRVRK